MIFEMRGQPATSTAPLLELRAFGVAFGERVILQDLSLEHRGACLSIIGHAGAGKSTLLRTLAGLNDAQPELRITGEALYSGQPLGHGPRPWLVGQKARLLLSTVFENIAQALSSRDRMSPAEQRGAIESLVQETLGPCAPPLDARVIELPLDLQRCFAIVRGVAAGSDLLMVDEPTAGLSEEGRARVLGLLLRESERRAVLQVTHHLGDVRALGGDLALLVGGRLVERSPVGAFFSGPRTAAGRTFLETGTCYFERGEAPSASVDPGEASAGEPPAPVSPPPSKYLHWVVPGRLLGMPRPGVIHDLDDDLATLQRLGIAVVLTLEETRTVPEGALARFGMQLEHVPIEDMGAPAVEVAAAACASIHAHLGAGRAVAVHCLGGAGRTGLMLAAYFIFLGSSALDALEAVRRVQPRFVQSDVQVDFLSSFELSRHLAN